MEKDEITAFRDKTEDDLRIKVLSVYGEQEQIAKLQKIFNGLWDKDGIEYLWAEAIKADDYQAEPILALLVYLRTKHDGCEIGELLKLKFDWLYAHIREFREGTSKKFGHYPAHDNLSGVILRALAAYGSAKLLTPGFWSLLGTYQVGGQTTLRCLQRMVDERTLQDLKEFEKTCPWTNKRELLDLIAEIESRLNAAKKQNETSKP